MGEPIAVTELDKRITVSARELRVLKVLAKCAGDYEDYGYMHFKDIAKDARLNRIQVRSSVRALARKGLAKYGSGLCTEDGDFAGSGYCCTKKGADFIAAVAYKKGDSQ